MPNTNLNQELLELGTQNSYLIYNENLIITEALALGLYTAAITTAANAINIGELYIIDNVSDPDHNKLAIRLDAVTVKTITIPASTYLRDMSDEVAVFNGTDWVYPDSPQTLTTTTTSIADGAFYDFSFTAVAKVTSITSDQTARVRFYKDTAARSADLSASTVSAYSVEVVDYNLSTGSNVILSPIRLYGNPTVMGRVYNNSGAAAVITVDIDYL